MSEHFEPYIPEALQSEHLALLNNLGRTAMELAQAQARHDEAKAYIADFSQKVDDYYRDLQSS